jgi:membrane-bound ClpP family serine protease
MEIITIILLILLGVVLLLIEFLLIPGISVAGVGCLVAFGASVFFAFKFFGSLVGFIVLAAILITVPLFLYFLFKGKAMKPMMLSADIDGKMKNVEEGQLKPGDEGETIGRLAPAGKAKINGITLEVRTNGQFVDQKTKIKVLKIEGNSVYVEPIKEE